MRPLLLLGCIGFFATSVPAQSADYNTTRTYRDPPPVFVGIAPPRPVYLVASPPQYIQDLRTGQPGRWVVLQPSFFDRLFGERNGY